MNPRPQKSRMLNINFYKTRFFALSALFGFTISAYASMDLAYWNTNTVKSGQPWMQIDTKITSVNLDLEIDHGIVKTHATIEYMPSNGTVYNSGCGPSIVCVDTLNSKCIPSICESQSMSSVMDSLETNTSFQLEENTAINDMYLWVGNVRVRAALQERGLASAQYESIVQRRKDPALLETWGNGNYNLRIFPTQSGLKRKLEINFIQGLENNGGLMSTVLPFISSLYKINNPASLYADQGINKNIGEMSLNAISKDGLTYKLDWPGLGSGTVNARGLKLNAKNIEELKGGNISRNVNATLVACPNCLESWTAQKAGTSYFGVKALIDHKNLKLEAEPLERDIIVDVDDNDTLGPDRARKFALLALKAYAKAPYKGNLGFSDGKGKINFVFPNAVSMNATYLNIAYENLKRWVPVSKANSKMTLESFAKLRGNTAEQVVAILINNEPYSYYPYPPYDMPVDWVVQNQKAQEFEKVQQVIYDGLELQLKNSKTILFGFWNNYRLSQVANSTGGYGLGGMAGWLYQPFQSGIMYEKALTTIVDTTIQITPPKIKSWTLPALFGIGRNDGSGLNNLSVTSSGISISNLTMLLENQYSFYSRGFILDKVQAKTSNSIACCYSYNPPESSFVRLAGQYTGSGSAAFTFSGTLGGLKFSQKFSATLQSGFGSSEDGSRIWANQQGEVWTRDYGKDHVLDLQELGRDYHIVNPQMSLLALEPSMTLWTDLPSNPNNSNSNQSNLLASSPSTDMASEKMRGPDGTNIDGTTLAEILNGSVLGIQDKNKFGNGRGEMKIVQAAGKVKMIWALPASLKTENEIGPSNGRGQADFQIVDLNGKKIWQQSIVKSGEVYSAEWASENKRGTYYLIARLGSYLWSRKIVLNP